MPDYDTLVCTSCGAPLHVRPTTTSLICDYCGREHVVKRRGGEVLIEHINTWPCPECGTHSAVGTGFCPKCGFVLARNCPACKQRIYALAVYCPECGVNIEDSEKKTILSNKKTRERREEIELDLERLKSDYEKLNTQKPPKPGGCLKYSLIAIFAVFVLAMLGVYDTSVIFFIWVVIGAVFIINRNKSYRAYRTAELKVVGTKNEIMALEEELKQLINT